MSRPKFKRDWKLAWRPFYVAAKKFSGAALKGGVKSTAGEPTLYNVAKGGNLVKL